MARLPRRPHDDVADLAPAIHWLRTAWTTLPVPPARLHDRDIEELSALGSHRFSAPFWRIITGRATDEVEVTESVECHHPGLTGNNAYDCVSCLGSGMYEHRVRRYRSPMAAALHRLSKMPRPSDGTPAPVEYVMALAASGWDVRTAAQALGYFVLSPDHAKTIDAMFLMNLRRLHGHYSAGPIGRVPYTELSESQRNAEDAA